jgi:hypothetical protein
MLQRMPFSDTAVTVLPPGRDAASGAIDGEIAVALEFLGQRHSVGPKHLEAPAPSDADLRCATAIALRAPDHRQLRPFRFVRVSDERRATLASLFAADAARRGHGAEEVERARERAGNGPALIALIAKVQHNVDDVPDHEQWMTVGAGAMNFLNALHLMGFGAKLLSGASVRDPAITAVFCRADEQMVAWILAGTPAKAPRAKASDNPEAHFTVW